MTTELKESWQRGVAKRDIDLRSPGMSVSGALYKRVLKSQRAKAKAAGRRLILMDGTIEDYS